MLLLLLLVLCCGAQWRKKKKKKERSLAASPAVCSLHRREEYYVLSSLSAIIALPSTPEDLVPLTAITHCHFSSLRVSMQCLLFFSSSLHPPTPFSRTPPMRTEVVALLWAETPTGGRHLFGSRIKLAELKC